MKDGPPKSYRASAYGRLSGEVDGRLENFGNSNHQIARNMKNKSTLIVRLTKWIMAILAVTSVANLTQAEIVYDNSATPVTDGGGSKYVVQSGYQFGDEVLMSGNISRFLTNFSFEFYADATAISAGATVQLKVYAMNGSQYGYYTNDASLGFPDGTPYYAPGDTLYDSGAKTISSIGGFSAAGFMTWNLSKPDFMVYAPSNFAWTVTFGSTGGGVVGLSEYDSPVVGSDFSGFWEASGAGGAWVLKTNSSAVDFGAVATAAAVVADSLIPTLAITTPTAAVTTTNGQVLMVGTAGDNKQVAMVLYKVNSGSFLPATITGSSGTKSNWTATAMLSDVYNNSTITVKAIDASGNASGVMTKTAKFNSLVPFTASVAGNGLVPIGTIKLGATGADVTSISQDLVVGQTYALAAKANANVAWFSNFVQTVNGVSSVTTNTATSPYTVKFVMQTNFSLVANIVTNQFFSVAGNYSGLFSQNGGGSGVTNDYASSGYFKATLDSKKGWSATIYLNGKNYVAAAGKFNLDGTSVGGITVKVGTVPTYLVKLTAKLDGSGDIGGSVSNMVSGWVSELDGNLNPFASGSGTFATTNTIVIPGYTNDSATLPGGYGVLTAVADNKGNFKYGTTGNYLADQDALTPITTTYAANGDVPFYAPAYFRNGAANPGLGSVIGWMNISSGAAQGRLYWVKQASSDTIYPNGFTNSTDISASVYAVPGKNGAGKYTNSIVALGGGVDTSINSDGVAELGAGDLVGSPIDIAVRSYTNTAIQAITTPSYKFAITPVPGNGLFGPGAFTNGPTTYNIRAAALQSQNVVLGSFKATAGATTSGYLWVH